MVLTQLARSLDPKIACTSHCGVGELYSPYPQALMIKDWHYFLTELCRFRGGLASGWMVGSISARALGLGVRAKTLSPCSHKMEPQSRHVSSKILNSVRLI